MSLFLSMNNNLNSTNSYVDNFFQTKTLQDLINDFLLTKKSVETKRSYLNDLNSFFKFVKIVKVKDLFQIPFPLLSNYIFNYLDSISKRDPYRKNIIENPKTVNRKAYSLSSFFKYLMSVYNYPVNPLDNFQELPMKKYSTTESLTFKEVCEILEYLQVKKEKSHIHCRNYLIFLFLSGLALRRSELINLKWADIDYIRKTINIFQKGGTYKELPLPELILKNLNDYEKQYKRPSKYIFHPVINNRSKDTKKPISADLIFKIVVNVVQEVLPGKNITPHSFRKSFIEISLEKKIDIITIQNATGHKTLEGVRYYDTRSKIENNAVHHFFIDNISEN